MHIDLTIILQIVGLLGLELLAASAFGMGAMNGYTPAKIRSQGFFCLGAFLVFASVFSWLSIVGIFSMRDSRTINLMGSFIFVVIMGEILLDARAARKAKVLTEDFSQKSIA